MGPRGHSLNGRRLAIPLCANVSSCFQVLRCCQARSIRRRKPQSEYAGGSSRQADVLGWAGVRVQSQGWARVGSPEQQRPVACLCVGDRTQYKVANGRWWRYVDVVGEVEGAEQSQKRDGRRFVVSEQVGKRHWRGFLNWGAGSGVVGVTAGPYFTLPHPRHQTGWEAGDGGVGGPDGVNVFFAQR